MPAPTKHKPQTWRENRGAQILKYRNEIAPKIVEKMLKEEELTVGFVKRRKSLKVICLLLVVKNIPLMKRQEKY